MSELVVVVVVVVIIIVAWRSGGALARGVDRQSGSPKASMRDEVVVAPEWAIAQFGHDVAFEMSRRGKSVMDTWRGELATTLAETAASLHELEVVQVRAQVGRAGGWLSMTFADGTELDASELDGGDVALELAGASRWGPTSLVALELDGPVAVVIVENDGVRYRVRARELEVRR